MKKGFTTEAQRHREEDLGKAKRAGADLDYVGREASKIPNESPVRISFPQLSSLCLCASVVKIES